MSYILDALKKADAERARDAAAVPDLYAQGDVTAEVARGSSGGLKWMLLALLAVLLAGLAWAWLSAVRDAPARLGEPDRPPAPAPAPAPAPVAAPAPTPTPPMPRAADAPAARPLPSPPQAQPPTVVPHTATAVSIAPPHATTTPAPSSERTPKPTVGASAASPAPPAVTLAELPADLRAQLPALTVGGSVYSPVAASRIVILNGQVFREGDQPAAGLTVEQIGLKSTVLVFRGVRFELKH